MEPELLHFTLVFLLGAAVGIVIMLLVNKLRSGSAAPRNVQQEFDSYQAEVEHHFEETSKKFKNMTEQYQELYQHLSIGATSLCRPDSVAAALADARSPMDKLVDLSDSEEKSSADKHVNAQPGDALEDAVVKPVSTAAPTMADQNINADVVDTRADAAKKPAVDAETNAPKKPPTGDKKA
ncbi:hypothetical protein GCM10008090_21350 [Arenicella chitinivorans]|uniref:Z-ring associated protein G n=1 Tax=Arenicella chitinivorans TaxID=1329800 RepID=A0A918VNG9_9GAMM|nr:DUF1043 family protein [Arenicella chitinivorans]GHA11318.1 hypothetical protein GCM10008090_21350 [Arenicella chitinivorans]